MSTATVRIPTPLRSFTGGSDEVRVKAENVKDALDALAERHAGIRERLLDERGDLRHFVNVFVGAQDIRSLHGLDTELGEGDVISIIPAVAGGLR